MINKFIEKVIVYEADRTSGEREQEMDIYLNFIGKFEIPPKEMTTAEIEEEEKKRKFRAQRREYETRYRWKKKQKRIAAEQEQQQTEIKKTA